MTAFFKFLAENPFLLLFFTVGLAVWIGRFSYKGYGLGMVAAAIVVGCALSVWASTYGAKLKLDDFAKSLFYYLFMYGVGLRVGPSFINGLKGDGLKFTVLAFVSCIIGLAIVVAGARMFDLPQGAAGGMLAGSQTMSAAIGSAEQAVTQGAVKPREGKGGGDATAKDAEKSKDSAGGKDASAKDAEKSKDAGGKEASATSAEKPKKGGGSGDASSMIALAYGITYIWGTVGIILICKYLPRWWGVDARAAAKRYEEEKGVTNVDDAGLSGYRAGALRAYKLTNDEIVGWSVKQFISKYPQFKIVNVRRPSLAEKPDERTSTTRAAAGGSDTKKKQSGNDGLPAENEAAQKKDDRLGAPDDLKLEAGDIIALGGRLETMTKDMGLIGPEVADERALDIPLDEAEILVTNKEVDGKELGEFRKADFAGQIAVQKLERGGVPIPLGLKEKVQRFDVLYIVGLKGAVEDAAKTFGKIARPSTATDLLTLAVGMIVGLLIGQIEFPAFGAKVGLGNAGGLLVSGIFVSSVQSRLRFFGNTPNAARNILEDLGLVVFVAIVGINAGNSLLEQLTGALALKIFLIGFVACTIPPFVVWAIGYHFFKINPALLMGGVAGARSHSGPCREAAKEIDSSVPWVGFPVAYAISGILLTVGGYFAMVLAG